MISGQREKPSRLIKCLEEKQKAGDLSDVSLVGDDGVPVATFRLVLACASPVFQRMLYGDFAEAKKDRVHIPESNQAVLQALVEFCISETTQMKKKSLPALLDLVQLSILGDTYQVEGLEDHVLDEFSRKLGNVGQRGLACPLLALLPLEASPKLYHAALEIIRKAPDATLKKGSESGVPGITCLPYHTFKKVMESNQWKWLAEHCPVLLFERISDWYQANHSEYEQEARDLCRAAASFFDLPSFPSEDLISIVSNASFVDPEQLRNAFEKQADWAATYSKGKVAVCPCENGEGLQCNRILFGSTSQKTGERMLFHRVSNNQYRYGPKRTNFAGNTYVCNLRYSTSTNSWKVWSNIKSKLLYQWEPKEGAKYPTTGWVEARKESHYYGTDCDKMRVKCACNLRRFG